MDASLAIYEALIQANVPPLAARRVAESLEKDMSTNLATKQDLQHFGQLIEARLEALEGRTSLLMQNLESRLLIKLGVLMSVLFGIAGTGLALFR